MLERFVMEYPRAIIVTTPQTYDVYKKCECCNNYFGPIASCRIKEDALRIQQRIIEAPSSSEHQHTSEHEAEKLPEPDSLSQVTDPHKLVVAQEMQRQLFDVL